MSTANHPITRHRRRLQELGEERDAINKAIAKARKRAADGDPRAPAIYSALRADLESANEGMTLTEDLLREAVEAATGPDREATRQAARASAAEALKIVSDRRELAAKVDAAASVLQEAVRDYLASAVPACAAAKLAAELSMPDHQTRLTHKPAMVDAVHSLGNLFDQAAASTICGLFDQHPALRELLGRAWHLAIRKETRVTFVDAAEHSHRIALHRLAAVEQVLQVEEAIAAQGAAQLQAQPEAAAPQKHKATQEANA